LSSSPEVCIGITTWNSELFLEHCLRSVQDTLEGRAYQLVVADNQSNDRSVEIASDLGAEVHIEYSSQAVALNRLLAKSKAPYTLLLHSDVVLLSPHWLDVCAANLAGDSALVSPEDVGCGPLTRPYGAGMPESCFMFFDTAKARNARTLAWVRRARLPWPWLRLDFDHYYVTHHLPEVLSRKGYDWVPMRVHASPAENAPIYQPTFTPEYWSEEFSRLRYGMGNFYSLDGVLTHYHNWFDRVPKDVPAGSMDTTEGEGKGLPLAFLSEGTKRFLEDLIAGALVLPDADEPQRVPKLTQRYVPDLTRQFDPRHAQPAPPRPHY
jgi:glycosyltransferase involved in cell wall biosynthesis